MLDASWASVLAVERKRVQAAGDVEALASANGGALPVTRFRVLESDAVGVLTAMKQWSIRVHPAWFPDRGIEFDVERDVSEVGWESEPGQ